MQASQSTILVGALLAAFIVWLAMNGRLNAYWALLTGAASSTSTAATPGTSSLPGTSGTGPRTTITVTPLPGNIVY